MIVGMALLTLRHLKLFSLIVKSYNKQPCDRLLDYMCGLFIYMLEL